MPIPKYRWTRHKGRKMISKASARFIRVSPRKVRQVVDVLRGKGVNEAFAILSNINKGAAVYVEEILQSAVSNALRKQTELSPPDLYISKFTVDGGPTMVRYRAASMGRATMIRRRTSHLNIELEIKESAKKEKNQPSARQAKRRREKKNKKH